MASTDKTTTKELNNHLETLFDFTSPRSMRQTITYLYFSHVMEIKNLEVLPPDFDRMSAEVFMLIDFLEKAEEKNES